jgi:hypothetical protein
MTQDEFITDIRGAQLSFNNLLMRAYQFNIKVELALNNPNCVDNDQRQVVGIELYHNKPLYKNDGIP